MEEMSLGELVKSVIEASQGGEWSMLVALVIMILVYLVQKVPFIKSWLPKEAKPWVAVGAGVLASVATVALSTGDWVQAVLHGLVTGSAASGFWELVGKRLLGGSSDSKESDSAESDES